MQVVKNVKKKRWEIFINLQSIFNVHDVTPSHAHYNSISSPFATLLLLPNLFISWIFSLVFDKI